LADTAVHGKSPARFSKAVARGLREGAVILTGVAALMLLTSLLSYSPEDPGFSFTGGGSEVSNLIGRTGAWFADVLLFLFGGPAFLFPLMLGAACGLMFRHREDAEAVSRVNTIVRVGGFVMVLFGACALATLHWSADSLRQSAGGVVGSLIGHSVLGNFNFLGATLLLLALCMTGISLAFGISWFQIMDRTGAAFWSGVDWIKARRIQRRDAAEGEVRREARKEVA